MASRLDEQIDELYQLPLDQFTPRRNALAKELRGDARARVKALVKPSSAMWAINQLYWRDRSTYNALVSASEALRSAHRALLSGRKSDVRKPEAVHKAAVERALVKATAIARTTESDPSAATLDIVRRTLFALPTDEDPGRLTRPPEPAGFSLLTGVKPATPESQPPRRGSSERKPSVEKEPDAAMLRQIQKAAEKRAREEEATRLAEAAAERKLAKARAANERRLKSAREAAERAAAQLREAERRMAELEARKK